MLQRPSSDQLPSIRTPWKNTARSTRPSPGFTLLEVLIALAIVAVVSAGMYNVRSGHIMSMQRAQEKTLAHWVALNKLTEFYHFEEFPTPGLKKYDATMADIEWRIEAKVEKTDNENLRRVVIMVGTLPKRGQEFHAITSLLGLVARRE